MNPIDISTTLSSLTLKPKASSCEQFQYWLARKVFVEKSSFWKAIASVFQRILPYFLELKTKMEGKPDQLQNRIITKIEIESQEKTVLPSIPTTQPKAVANVDAPSANPVEVQAPSIETPVASEQPASGVTTPAASIPVNNEPDAIEQQKIKAKIEGALSRTAFNINNAVSFFLNDLIERPQSAATMDISWPVKTAWNKLSSLWQTPKEKNPLFIMSEEVQQSIESIEGSGKNWLEKQKEELEKQKEEIEQDLQKMEKGEFDQEAFKKFQLRKAKLRFVLNANLPNEELPLHYAIRLGKPEMVKLLLSLGADPVRKNDDEVEILRKDGMGNTAWDSAALRGNPEITNILRDYFKNLFKAKIAMGFNSIISQGIPLSPQVFQILEDNVKDSIGKLLGSSSKTMSDPLAIPTLEKVRLASWASLLLLYFIADKTGVNLEAMKLGLGSSELENSYFAQGLSNLVGVASTIGAASFGLEASRHSLHFISGIIQGRGLEGFDPYMIVYGLQLLSDKIPPLYYLEKALLKIALASSLIDVSALFFANIRQRPLAAIKKISSTAANLWLLNTNIFTKYLPTHKDCPELFKNLFTTKTENDNLKTILFKTVVVPTLTKIEKGVSTAEDRNALNEVFGELLDKKNCYQSYIKLIDQFANSPEILNSLNKIKDISC